MRDFLGCLRSSPRFDRGLTTKYTVELEREEYSRVEMEELNRIKC